LKKANCCVLQDHYDYERDNFHKTTHLQKTRLRSIFLASDRSCPKTDGLRPHHWWLQLQVQPVVGCADMLGIFVGQIWSPTNRLMWTAPVSRSKRRITHCSHSDFVGDKTGPTLLCRRHVSRHKYVGDKFRQCEQRDIRERDESKTVVVKSRPYRYKFARIFILQRFRSWAPFQNCYKV